MVEEAVVELLRGMSRVEICADNAWRSPLVCVRDRGYGVIGRVREGGSCGDVVAGGA